MPYTDEEKCDILRIFYKNSQNVSAARREYQLRFPMRALPSRTTFKNVERGFRERMSVKRKKRIAVINQEEELNILLYFEENPNSALKDAADFFGKSLATIYRCLKRHGYHPYKILPVQKLNQEQKNKRIMFCQEMLLLKGEDNHIFKKILWSDECTFSTAGIHNRKNVRYWANQNPRVTREIRIQGRSSLHVWCGLLENKIIGPIFIDGCLNGEKYLNLLTNDVENYLDNLPLRQYNQIIWHQDGAPPHNVFPVINYLNGKYETWIGRTGPIRWPPNSPDLTPLDSFLWGFLQNKVYETPTEDLEVLRARIIGTIQDTNENNSQFIINSINKIERDYRQCIEMNGGHIEQL